MSRRRPKTELNDYEYTEVLDDDVDSGDFDTLERNESDTKTAIPYKTLAFIFFFFVMGSVCENLFKLFQTVSN